MASFDERERAFEAKFTRDAELQFKAEARRNKLIGLWAAGLLGKSGDDAEAYARDVIRADFQEAGEADVVRKLMDDLGDRATAETIRAKMGEMLAEAKRQIMGEIG